jgi:hypothetical protein
LFFGVPGAQLGERKKLAQKLRARKYTVKSPVEIHGMSRWMAAGEAAL